jgi:hypothetical protein
MQEKSISILKIIFSTVFIIVMLLYCYNWGFRFARRNINKIEILKN